MKHAFLALACFLALLPAGLAQTPPPPVKKFPGEPITFAWTYTDTDRILLGLTGGFRIKRADSLTGTYTDVGIKIEIDDRTATVPATFASGVNSAFYVLTAFNAWGVESVKSTPVEIQKATLTAPAALIPYSQVP
jgi:hypothetical protein